MDPTNTVTPPHSLDTARVIPIAELCPDLAEQDAKVVGGVVTITWPYNKVKGTFAFNLAEPDFRLRRNKGQVRIDFTGRAARTIGECGLGGNDEVLLSLKGAAWEVESINKRRSLPGADIGWKLVFSESLALKIKRAETNETDLVIVNERPNEHETVPDLTPIQPLAITKSPSPPAPFPPHLRSPAREINTNKFSDSEFASPAFVKRARMSYGSLFEDGFDIFQDDGGVEGRGRKRTRFGRDSSAWRYTSQSPSPAPAAESPESVNEQVSSLTRVVSSPTQAQMADGGCQTMEPDQSSPRPISTPPEAQTEAVVSKDVSVSDAPVNTATDSAMEQGMQGSPSKGWFSESTVQNAPVPDPNELLSPDLGASLPHSDQQPGFSEYSFAGNPWTMSTAPSGFEPQQKTPLPLQANDSFAPSGFGHIESTNQPIPFDESGSLEKTYALHDQEQESSDDGVIRSTEQNSSTVDYSTLEPAEDTHPQPIHDEALTDYPAIYLEGGHVSQTDQTMTEQTSHYPAVIESGPSSWATINHGSMANPKAPAGRLRSRDGDTPEQALVIDESEAESDSEPEPMAVEDTVNSGRAYALDMYEDAEAEDEVDAQYSDDDEPEYDADEMGGDYDTRNYERPGDDDDGSPDEDLRPQPLEPEFDDGESWDEEEQEEFRDEGNEGEYEMDEEIAEPTPQPAVRANPTVIDLISSSEDEEEGEEEDEGDTEIERSDAHIDPRMSSSHHQITLESNPHEVNDDVSEIVSQASVSEAENSSEVGEERREYPSSYEEEEMEYEDEDEDEDESKEGDNGSENEEDNQEEIIGDEVELESSKQEEIQEFASSENQVQQHVEPDVRSMPEASPEDGPIPDDSHSHADVSYRQTEAKMGSYESDGVETIKEIPGEGPAIKPLSAADGLEMLSRAVDKESDARSHKVLTESVVAKVVETVSDEQSSAEPTKNDITQMQNTSSYHDILSEGALEELAPHLEKPNELNPIASSNPNTSHPSPIINEKKPTTAAPSSPPLTQSFRSAVEDNLSTIDETVVASASQIANAQLPTPHNTQTTDIALNTSTSTFMNITESFESYTTIVQQDSRPGDGTVFGKSADDLAQQDGNTTIGQDSFEQERDGTSTMRPGAQRSSSESPAASSPAPSFQTQVDDTELALPDTIEQSNNDQHNGDNPNNDNQSHPGFSPEYDSSASDISRSFASHMEVDEELQASILEYSQLEGYLDYDTQDENDGSVQIEAHDDYVESEQPSQIDSVSSLHEHTPTKQLAEEISAQLKRNFIEIGRSSGEESDTSARNDPSVRLARVAIASKRKRKRAASTDSYRPRKRLFDTRRSPSPETDDSSIRFARASLASQTPRSDEDSYSMTAAKLQLARHLRDELPDCTSLKVLRQHLTKSLDVIAVAVMTPPDPRRAKGGPREFMMSFTISDYSIGPYAVAEALIYRPHRDTLPVIRYGDVVLLRNFTVVSLANKGFGLRTNENSSWAVFDYEGEPAQINGPPVEYGERETLYVDYLREWFRLLDIKAREKLEMANQRIINAGKSK
ncbi:hypothetical protein GGR58DRAFT_485456 [Xylaria digitata]|nr:hypothetical protein GGR58DRAFT_485456 [Xylaria digitata]